MMKVAEGKIYRCLEDDVKLVVDCMSNNRVDYTVIALGGAYRQNEVSTVAEFEEEINDGSWEEL